METASEKTASPGKADVWRQRIEAQRASGQTIRAWCRANATGEHSFYWWRARLGLTRGSHAGLRQRRRPGSRRCVEEPLSFAQVRMDEGHVVEPAAAAWRLRLAGGRELMVPASLPIEQVAQLVRAIERAT
jgi:hypothetical protein